MPVILCALSYILARPRLNHTISIFSNVAETGSIGFVSKQRPALPTKYNPGRLNFVFAKNGAVLCRQRGPRLLKFAKYNNYEYDVGRVVVVAQSAELSISQSEGRGSNPLIGKIYC